MSSALDKPGARALIKAGPARESDHVAFHTTVLKTAAGAAAGGLLAHILHSVIGGPLGGSGILLAGVATGALAMVTARKKHPMRGLFGAGLGLLGSALALFTSAWPPFAFALLGAAAAPALAEGESTRRKVATGVLASFLSAAGLYVANVMLTWDLLAGVVPAPLATAAAGAVAGMFVGLSAAPKFLGKPRDPVETAFEAALELKDGELHDILARALEIQRAVKAELSARAGDSTIVALDQRVGELMLRVLRIADQCRTIEHDLAATPAFELEERISQLEKKADASQDEAARETYQSAVASLQGQKQALDAIERGRERVVARLHANVALLEKVRFSLLHLRSADAEQSGAEASPVAQALEELSRELDATSTAVGEVYGKSERSALPEPLVPDNVVRLSDGRTPGVLDQRDAAGEE